MSDPAVRFSILVPLYRTQPGHFREMVASVLAQTEPSFEAVLVDDGSADEALTALLEEAAADPRIRVVVLPENRGISAASAAGLAEARGEFVALLDHDDLLEPTALAVVRDALERFPDADVLYTDEDQLHDDGSFTATFRKPVFSPERLRGQQYLGHLCVIRRTLLEEIGGFRLGYEGSQDYDLVLRATERARLVVHVPEVVYHWRIHRSSVSHRSDNAPVFDAARRALSDHLDRIGVRGTVEQVHETGVYRIRRLLTETPRVTVIIATRGSRSVVHGAERVLVVESVRSVLARTTYPAYDVLVVADAATPASVRAELLALDPCRVRVIDYPYPFSYTEKNNLGAVRATGDLLLLLNDDTEVVSPDWLDTMVGLLAPDVGLVGAKLLYEDGTVQHLGLHVGGEDVGHLAEGKPADVPGPFSDFWVDREVSGVTGACVLIPRRVFEEVGGLSAALPVSFNDVDLGFKVLDAGYRILVTPHAVLYHFESRSRRRSVAATEVFTFRRRWAHRLRTDDFWRHETPAEGPRAVAPGHR